MKIGLIGLPNSGKTTIFNALTGLTAEITSYSSGKAEPNLSVVNVIDERITKLSEMYNPKKTIYATIEFIDFVGLNEGAGREGLFSGSATALIKNTDALCVVARNFDDALLGDPTPFDDVEKIMDELLISDLIIAEKRLEKIELAYKRGQKTATLQFEEKVIKRIIEQLNENLPIRDLNLSDDELKSIRGFQFLTLKPAMVILNSSEDNFNNSAEIYEQLNSKYKTLEFAGNFEMELNQLDEEEASEFMKDMGIEKSAQDRLTKFAYELLGYISFFTVGKDEVRAWTITKGDNAVIAAGTIHSDLARGFIRAECFNYKDLIELGSEKAIREKGKFQLEGKEYIVKDGDILNIRFSV